MTRTTRPQEPRRGTHLTTRVIYRRSADLAGAPGVGMMEDAMVYRQIGDAVLARAEGKAVQRCTRGDHPFSDRCPDAFGVPCSPQEER